MTVLMPADYGLKEDGTMPARLSGLLGKILNMLERSGSTFVQQFVIVLMVGGGGATLLVTQNWLLAADTAGFAGIISLGTSLVSWSISPLSPWADLAMRVVKTFGQSMLGSLTASVVVPSVVHAPWLGALAIAVPVALTALLKGLAAMALPYTNGASLLPV